MPLTKAYRWVFSQYHCHFLPNGWNKRQDNVNKYANSINKRFTLRITVLWMQNSLTYMKFLNNLLITSRSSHRRNSPVAENKRQRVTFYVRRKRHKKSPHTFAATIHNVFNLRTRQFLTIQLFYILSRKTTLSSGCHWDKD